MTYNDQRQSNAFKYGEWWLIHNMRYVESVSRYVFDCCLYKKYNCSRHAQLEAGFFTLPSLHFSVSFSQPAERWTAYQARTNHIWLLSVSVSYTLGTSCPLAAMQWKRPYHRSTQDSCFMYANQWFWWSTVSCSIQNSFHSLIRLFIDFISGLVEGLSRHQWLITGPAQIITHSHLQAVLQLLA